VESLIYPAVWTDIIAWLHFGLIEAEELGVTAANVDEMAKSLIVPAIQRLLGTSGDLGSRTERDLEQGAA
jgi:general L-amino acid transport system substrate-binding protein